MIAYEVLQGHVSFLFEKMNIFTSLKLYNL